MVYVPHDHVKLLPVPLFVQGQPEHGLAVDGASDKGFLSISTLEYIQLLDWTARQVVPGKPGATPAQAPELLERLGLNAWQWTELVQDFGRLFSLVAGLPETVAGQRTRRTQRPFHARRGFRELFAQKAA